MKELSDPLINSYLDIVAGSRLVFYSKKELGKIIGFRSLDSHSFTDHLTPEVKRGYFHSICNLADLKTDGTRLFENLLPLYIRASEYYSSNLKRSTIVCPERFDNLIAILDYLSDRNNVPTDRKMASICRDVLSLHIPFEILLLLILKSIRPAGSQNGDVSEQQARTEYRNAITFLRLVESRRGVRIGGIDRLDEKVNGDFCGMSRVHLIYQTGICLDQYYDTQDCRRRVEFRKGYFSMLERMKDARYFNDGERLGVFYEFRDGYLTEYRADMSNGSVIRTDFYFRISPGIERCSYQEILLIHPAAINNIAANRQYDAWKFTADYETDSLEDISWIRFMPHPSRDVPWFKPRILKRVTDEDRCDSYDRILKKCETVLGCRENGARVREIRIFALTSTSVIFDFRAEGKGFLVIPVEQYGALADLNISSPCLHIDFEGKEYMRFTHEDLTVCIQEGDETATTVRFASEPF